MKCGCRIWEVNGTRGGWMMNLQIKNQIKTNQKSNQIESNQKYYEWMNSNEWVNLPS